MPFKVVPKFYYFQHLPRHILRGGVPRTYWVYSNESKNRQIKQLWRVMFKGHATLEQVFLRLLWLGSLECK
jgi:hypothetical protein